MFPDEKSADILFEIHESDDASEPTKIHANHLILQACAITLAADICEGGDEKNDPCDNHWHQAWNLLCSTSLCLWDMGRTITQASHKDHFKGIIERVEAEAVYVKTTQISILCRHKEIYARCPILDKISFKDIPESKTMFTDFLAAVAMRKSDDKEYDGDYPTIFKYSRLWPSQHFEKNTLR